METLNDILGLSLLECDIFDINEEKIILLKNESYNTQNKFYFWLYNESIIYYKNQMIKESAYCNYLLSYYVLIIMLPFCYEDIAFNFAELSVKQDSNIKYKEWLLLFSTFEKKYLDKSTSINLAKEVLESNKDSILANQILYIN